MAFGLFQILSLECRLYFAVFNAESEQTAVSFYCEVSQNLGFCNDVLVSIEIGSPSGSARVKSRCPGHDFRALFSKRKLLNSKRTFL